MSWLVDISPLITARDECEDTTCHNCPIWVGYCGDMIKLLMDLPRVERKKGKWIGEPKDGIEAMFFKPKCSVCGFESAEVKNYCPMCGARLGEDDDIS